MEFKLTLLGGWWYSAFFALVNLFFIFMNSKTRVKRLFRFPKFKSNAEKIVSYISVILFTRGLIFLTVFIPIDFHLFSFIMGTSVFLAGLIFYTVATNNFLTTPENHPVTRGVYKHLRHPMQVLSVLMWIGVSIATISWLILAACIIQMFLSYPFLIAQERECLERYGESYNNYLSNVKRYYLF